MNMAEENLFKEIRDEYQSYELPFDEADWDSLVTRLDKKEQKKAVFFVSRKLYVPAAAAAIAASVILIVSILSREPQKDIVATDNHNAVPNNVARNEQPVIDTNAERASQPVFATVPVIRSAQYVQKEINRPVVEETSIAVINDTARTEAVPSEKIVETKPTNNYVNRSNKPVNYPKEVEWGGMNQGNVPSGVRLAANGGLNYNTSKLGYSIGASISKSISKKVSIQADIAFLDNSRQSSYSQMNVTERQVNGLSGAYIERDTSYQKTTKDFKQNYAQVALSVDLALTKANSVSVGVDVQRLLNGEQEIDGSVTSFQRASSWNSGVLLRYRYDLNQKLSLGLSYRQDVTSALQNTWQNNALQVYLNYYIKSK